MCDMSASIIMSGHMRVHASQPLVLFMVLHGNEYQCMERRVLATARHSGWQRMRAMGRRRARRSGAALRIAGGAHHWATQRGERCQRVAGSPQRKLLSLEAVYGGTSARRIADFRAVGAGFSTTSAWTAISIAAENF